MTNPKCPDCRKRLIKIPCTEKEYICANDDCPANVEDRKKGYVGYVEYSISFYRIRHYKIQMGKAKDLKKVLFILVVATV